VTWSTAGEARGDVGSLSFRWGSGILAVTYQAVFPPNRATEFRLPAIPRAELAAPSAASTFEGASVWYDNIENGNGYADVLDGVALTNDLGTIRSQATHLMPCNPLAKKPATK
jgi:hypothetical protein